MPESTEDPLVNIDRVPWKDLTHAYGSAADVPEILRILWEGGDDERDEALSELYGNIWHQGSVYEATAHAVPFLIRIASHPNCRNADRVLCLLKAIAEGESYVDQHAEHERYRLAEDDPEIAAKRREERQHVKLAYEAVDEGFPRYLERLSDEGSMVRQSSVYLLSELTPSQPDIPSQLLDAAKSETSPHVLCCHALAAIKFAQQHKDSSFADRAHDILQLHENPSAMFQICMEALRAASSNPQRPSELAETCLASINAAETETKGEDYLAFPTDPSNFSEIVEAALSSHEDALIEWSLARFVRNDQYAKYSLIDVCEAKPRAPKTVATRISALLRDDSTAESQWEDSLSVLVAAGKAGIAALASLAQEPNKELAKLASEAHKKALSIAQRFDPPDGTVLPEPRTVAGCINSLRENQSSDDESQTKRIQALLRLRELADTADAAIPTLLETLKIRDAHTKIAAAGALWRITGDIEPILPTLEDQLRHGNLFYAARLARTIGSAASPLLPHLKAILENPERNQEEGTSYGEMAYADEALRDVAAQAIEAMRS